MSDCVFRNGDVVYHPVNGKGKVTSSESDEAYFVEFERFNSPSDWFKESELSFKPWPAPCHERPLEEGWYRVRNKLGYWVVSKHQGGSWFQVGSTSGELVLVAGLKPSEFKQL